jgi:hypothetical protein
MGTSRDSPFYGRKRDGLLKVKRRAGRLSGRKAIVHDRGRDVR